jgi:hypothetical protein
MKVLRKNPIPLMEAGMISGIRANATRFPYALSLGAFVLGFGVMPHLYADNFSYDYFGNDLTPNPLNFIPLCSNAAHGECFIEGFFTVANPLADNLSGALISPLNYDFILVGDPNRTIYAEFDPSVNLSTHNFEISTDASGDITAWNIRLTDPDDSMDITTSGDGVNLSVGELLYSNTDPGRWVVPEPSASVLLATAFCLSTALRRRRLFHNPRRRQQT